MSNVQIVSDTESQLKAMLAAMRERLSLGSVSAKEAKAILYDARFNLFKKLLQPLDVIMLKRLVTRSISRPKNRAQRASRRINRS